MERLPCCQPLSSLRSPATCCRLQLAKQQQDKAADAAAKKKRGEAAKAKAADAAGNVSVASSSVTLTIDTTAPTAATLVQGTGTSAKVLTLTGVEAGATVKILNGSTDVTSKFAAGANGTYTANVGAFTGSETLSLTATVTDAAGNTSAASIPLALDAAVRDGRIQRGQKLLLEGVGGGFTWSAVLIEF